MSENKQRSQTEVDQNVIDFLDGMIIKVPSDLVLLKNLIVKKLEFRPYDDLTKEQADSIQWKRTASEIICDGYVYEGKACSDLALVYLALCKVAGLDGFLVKLRKLDNTSSHSIVEINLNGNWFRIDPSSPDSIPVEGQLLDDQIWNKNWLGGWKVWKRGKDLWDLGLNGIEDEIKTEEN